MITAIHILLSKDITVRRADNDEYDKNLGFKNNAPFISCTSKINNTFIDNAED